MKASHSIFSFLLIVLFSACGGGDGDGGGDGGETNPFSSIAGTWDLTNVENGLTDVYYLTIRGDGTGAEYDYYGDDYDNIADCYVKFEFVMTHQGGSEFIVGNSDGSDAENLNVSLQDGNLRVEFSEAEVISYPPATGLSETDFTPICDDSVL